MRVITLAKIKKFAKKHKESVTAFENFQFLLISLKKVRVKSLIELQKTFSSAEAVGNLTVINITGNYRLICYIDYQKQVLFVRDVLTHKEYDREKWKEDSWYKKK